MGFKTGTILHCSICNSSEHNKIGHHIQVTRICKRCDKELDILLFPAYTSDGRKYRRSRCVSCFYKYAMDSKRGSFRRYITKLMGAAKDNNKRAKNLPFDLDIEYLMHLFEQQDGTCYYTGQVLSLVAGDNCMSIDRKNPEEGYVKKNVVFTSWRINRMKNDIPIQDFIILCNEISSYHGIV